MKVFLLSMLMVTLYCLFVPTDGYAQEDTFDTFQEPAVKNNTDKKKKSKRRKSGFFFKDSGTGYRWSNGRNEIRLGGFLQLDSRTYFEDGIDLGKDNFLLRRIQPLLEVRLGKTYRFYILPSFSAAPGILDVYAERRFHRSFNLRAGKFKAPFGLERLQSATALAFNERAFPTNLAPNREIGAQIFGEILGGTTEYQLGIFSGNIDNSAGLRDSVINSNNSGFDFVARVFAHPLKHTGPEFLEGLGLGIAYSYGTQRGSSQAGDANLPAFISPGQQSIARYARGAHADGSRERIGPQLYYHWGPFGIMSEYTISQQNIRFGTVSDKVTNDAFQVQLSWVLLNGDASFRRMRPSKPFALESIGSLGAVQLVARYSALNLDTKAFAHGLFDRDRSVSKAQDFGIGINWYLNRNVKFQIDYDQTHFSHGAADHHRPTEKILFSRMQIAF